MSYFEQHMRIYEVGSLLYRFKGEWSIYGNIPECFKSAFIQGQNRRINRKRIKQIAYNPTVYSLELPLREARA